MSLFPRMLLTCVASLFGVMMIAIAPPTDKAAFFYAFGAFCLAIASACVTRGRVAEFFGSVIGVSVLAIGVWYVFRMFADGPMVSGSRSQPSLLNALLFAFTFSAPSALYVWRARFGFRRKAIEDQADN
jgi:uncharacterized membrane protein